jgi:hypothetical protein
VTKKETKKVERAKRQAIGSQHAWRGFGQIQKCGRADCDAQRKGGQGNYWYKSAEAPGFVRQTPVCSGLRIISGKGGR